MKVTLTMRQQSSSVNHSYGQQGNGLGLEIIRLYSESIGMLTVGSSGGDNPAVNRKLNNYLVVTRGHHRFVINCLMF